jgi:hypothetical protein
MQEPVGGEGHQLPLEQDQIRGKGRGPGQQVIHVCDLTDDGQPGVLSERSAQSPAHFLMGVGDD